MKLQLLASTFAATLLLSGCAGTFSQVLNRPISSDHLDEPGEENKLKGLRGDRRLVRTHLNPAYGLWDTRNGRMPKGSQSGNSESGSYVLKVPPQSGDTDSRSDGVKYLVCAETQADAISSQLASSDLTLEGRGGLTDDVTEQLTTTYERTQLSDIVRQLSWQLCSARMNGDLKQEEYEKHLAALQYNTFSVLYAMAGKPEQKPAKPETVPDDVTIETTKSTVEKIIRPPKKTAAS